MKYASDEKTQIEKALWEVVKTASMALMRLNEIESQPKQEIQSEQPMKINPMAERLASLRMKSPLPKQQVKMPEVQPIRKASLTDDKIKSFATRIGNEILPKVSSDEYDIRILFKHSNTWNAIKDKIDSNSVKAIVGGVNDMIQEKLDEQEVKKQALREQEVKKQALLKQKQVLLRQAEEQKKLDLVESRKQKLANTIKAQKTAIMDSIIKEMKPFVKQGNLNSINVALQKSATWQSIKANLSSQQERNAFFSEMINLAGFLDKTSDFQRDVIPPNRDSFSTGVQTHKQTEKIKPSSSLPDGYSDDIGSTAPDSPVNKTLNLDRSDSHGRTPAVALNNITEVFDSGGSAKVIPDNKGFANNSSPLRQAGDEELENLWSTDEDEHEYDNEDAGGEYAGDDEIEEELDDDDFFNE